MGDETTVLEDGKEGKPAGGETTPNETTPGEGTPTVSQDLKETEKKDKETEDAVEKMLADGTPARKTITIPKDKFDEQNDKSKLYDKLSPLMAKLAEKPELVDQLLNTQDETLESRMARLEDETKTKKRSEMKTVITDAVSTWGDFQELWPEIRTIVASLEKQGLPYRDAVQRAYFAVNPDAIKESARIVDLEAATRIQNDRAKTGSSGGFRPVVHQSANDDARSFMQDSDIEFAKKMNIDPELYKKHAAFIDKFKHL